jgi:hypothetical protein
VTARKASAAAAEKSAAAELREAEAADTGFVTMTVRGIEVRLPVGDEMPVAVLETALAGGSGAAWNTIKAWVGEEQWATLVKAGMTKGDVSALDDRFGELLGN